MSKCFGVLLGAMVLGLTIISNSFASDLESSGDRDLTVKETIDSSSAKDKSGIGEVERETEHDIVTGREDHESLHENHESVKGESHEPGSAETHDSGAGSRESVDRLETTR